MPECTGFLSKIFHNRIMRLVFVKPCEYVSYQMNGRLTMVGIMPSILGPSFPLEHPPFFIVTEMEFDPYERGRSHDVQVVIIDEDGREAIRLNNHLSNVPGLPEGPTRLITVFPVGPVSIPKPGIHRLDVFCDGQKVGEERLPIVQVKPQQNPRIENI